MAMPDPYPNQLRRYRNLAGLTLADLAVLCGRSEALISRIERGQVRPSPQTLARLQTALVVRADALGLTAGKHGRGQARG
jgi:transcriptional regulator with XRE-family HTH domain